MAGLHWMAVMLAFFLSTEHSLAAVDQNRLADIVQGILGKYQPPGMFSIAVRIPEDQNRNVEELLQEVFNTDPPDNVKNVLNRDEVYKGTRVVAAKVLKRSQGGAEHAEFRVVDNFFSDDTANDNDMLLFYVYASPCVKKCTRNRHTASILVKIQEMKKWKSHAFVFSKIFKPKDAEANSKEELSGALQRLGSSIGLSNIFRCQRNRQGTHCDSCSSDNQVSNVCVSDDNTPPSPSRGRSGSRGGGNRGRGRSGSGGEGNRGRGRSGSGGEGNRGRGRGGSGREGGMGRGRGGSRRGGGTGVGRGGSGRGGGMGGGQGGSGGGGGMGGGRGGSGGGGNRGRGRGGSGGGGNRGRGRGGSGGGGNRGRGRGGRNKRSTDHNGDNLDGGDQDVNSLIGQGVPSSQTGTNDSNVNNTGTNTGKGMPSSETGLDNVNGNDANTGEGMSSMLSGLFNGIGNDYSNAGESVSSSQMGPENGRRGRRRGMRRRGRGRRRGMRRRGRGRRRGMRRRGRGRRRGVRRRGRGRRRGVRRRGRGRRRGMRRRGRGRRRGVRRRGRGRRRGVRRRGRGRRRGVRRRGRGRRRGVRRRGFGGRGWGMRRRGFGGRRWG